ncbi:MAG: glypican [Cyanobium sp. LacPavin_0818_WC50_MAG_67_9]|nr:glypican [Cyanobium sp. LacPavin_0818_WC50_MAG_67_9]
MVRFTTLRIAARGGPPPLLVAPVLALASVGALVIVPLLALAAIPVVITILVAMGWLLAFGLGLWALIEGLAAFERWMEADSRFQQ